MIIHFIWIGSIPHPELVAKIAAKMRYLKSMFRQVPDLKFYVWTTSDLQGILWNRFTAEHLITPNHKNPLNLEIKDVDELFSMSASPYLSPDTLRLFYTLFLKEKTGPGSNKAVAADMIRFLALFHLGGLYVDAGLEIIPLRTDRQVFGKQKLAIDDEPFDSLNSSDLSEALSQIGRSALSDQGNKLLCDLKKYDYALSYVRGHIDLQIMFFSSNDHAKEFLSSIISNLVNEMEPFELTRRTKVNELMESSLSKTQKLLIPKLLSTSDINRNVRLYDANNASGKRYSHTGATYNFIFQKRRHIHKIYFFQIEGMHTYRFIDFPEIRLQRPPEDKRKYENYRTKAYIPEDDTGFHSLVFPRGKKK